MTPGRTWWRLDSWMRPHRGGQYPAPRRLTVRERRGAAVRLVLALLVAAALAVFGGDGYLGVNLPWVLLAAAAVEAVHLVRSRAVGWTAATPAEPPTRPYRLRP